MVAKVHALGRSFAGVAAYCLHDAPERDEGERPETDGGVSVDVAGAGSARNGTRVS